MTLILSTWRSRFKSALQAILWARIELDEREVTEAPAAPHLATMRRKRGELGNRSLDTTVEQDEARLWRIEQEEARAVRAAMEEEF